MDMWCVFVVSEGELDNPGDPGTGRLGSPR